MKVTIYRMSSNSRFTFHAKKVGVRDVCGSPYLCFEGTDVDDLPEWARINIERGGTNGQNIYYPLRKLHSDIWSFTFNP